MQYLRLKLTNLSPYHIGKGSNYYDTSLRYLQSDTLSATLAAIKAQRDNNTDIKEFLESFAVSSAFPYYGDKFFLPKLQGRINVVVNGQDETQYRKKLKKIQWIEESLWKRLIKSTGNVIIKAEQIKGIFLLDEPTDDFKESPICPIVNQRVAVPLDESMDAEPFFFEWIFTRKKGGLYFLLDADEHAYDEIVHLLKELGTMGFGSDKNIGGGHFDVDARAKDVVEIEDAADSNCQALLSMYIPSQEEHARIDYANSAYQIALRGGFMAGSTVEAFKHLRKKTVHMIQMGSLLSTDVDIHGKVVDLAPAWNDEQMHPVYRSGKPICVKIKK